MKCHPILHCHAMIFLVFEYFETASATCFIAKCELVHY